MHHEGWHILDLPAAIVEDRRFFFMQWDRVTPRPWDWDTPNAVALYRNRLRDVADAPIPADDIRPLVKPGIDVTVPLASLPATDGLALARLVTRHLVDPSTSLVLNRDLARIIANTPEGWFAITSEDQLTDWVP